MLGFEIILNGEPVTAAIEKGVLTVILTNRNVEGSEEISLQVAGLDLEGGTDTTWLKENDIKEGDEIIIKVQKVEKAATPMNVRNLKKGE
jgi:hypothetical protein